MKNSKNNFENDNKYIIAFGYHLFVIIEDDQRDAFEYFFRQLNDNLFIYI